MFLATLCAIAMFILPLFSWRFTNNVLCARKLRQISGSCMWWLLAAGQAVPLVILAAVVVFGWGVLALVASVAWFAGFAFWFFNH